MKAEKQPKTDNTKQRKEEKEDYFQLVPALMSCCHSSLLSHHISAVRAELPSSLRIIKRGRDRERKKDGHHIDTKSVYRQTHIHPEK